MILSFQFQKTEVTMAKDGFKNERFYASSEIVHNGKNSIVISLSVMNLLGNQSKEGKEIPFIRHSIIMIKQNMEISDCY